MPRFCQAPHCEKPLARKPGESVSSFNRRKNCNRHCGAKAGGAKRVHNYTFLLNSKVAKPTPEARWKPGGPVADACAGCYWVVGIVAQRSDVCRLRTDPVGYFEAKQECIFRGWV